MNERIFRRNVMVFGGSRGIGSAIVSAFAAAGAAVRFTYAGSKAAEMAGFTIQDRGG